MALEIVKPTVDLYFESDWGFSETDEITGDTTPTFVGTAPAGWHAWLYVGGVENVNAPVDALGNYSLTATAQGTGPKNFTVKVAINSAVADIDRSSPAALPVNIVPSETFTSATTFRVRMNEDLVLSGTNAANSQLQAAWPTATTRTLTKTGTGTVAIPDPNPNQLIKISDRTVTLTYVHGGGTTNFNVNSGTANNDSATKWTVEAHAPGVMFNSQVQNLAKLDIKAGGVATIAYTEPADPPTGQEIPYKVLHVRELAIAGTDTNPTGKLDITNNALVIDYGAGANPESQIRKWIIAGRATTDFIGLWTGNGITSSTAASNPSERSVGYADNGTMPLGPLSVFVGYTVDDNDVLVRYTVWGDTNLDGSVNDDDVTVQGAKYAPGVFQPFWSWGDFDYDGEVDDDDVTVLGALYNPFFDIDLHATRTTP